MNYKDILDEVYSCFKEENQFTKNKNINFFRESGTNIVKFEINHENIDIIPGTIIEQNHLVSIYFQVSNRNHNYIFLSKANIDLENTAIIRNILINNSVVESFETIKRKFSNRKDLYKFSNLDEIIQENELEEEMTNLISDLIGKKYQKNI